jgi:predicted Zn-dependent peptidase
MSEYLQHNLANGLRVISIEMPYHHSAEVLVYVGVGSRDESARKAGVSHFLEHMLFKGSADFPNGLSLERAFEKIGGSANAATDCETTYFHSRIHPQHVAEGIDIFSSMLQRPLFKDLESERKVILEEAMGDLNEKGRQINTDNITASLLFYNHPLGQPTVGHRRTIENLGLKQLCQHHSTYYSPKNTVLAIAGPVDHRRVVKAAEQSFGDWRGGDPPMPRPFDLQSRPANTLRWVRDAGSQISMQWAFLLPGRNNEHAVNLRVLRRVLGWGGMSRLMVKLREELGLTYAVDAALGLYSDAGVLSIDMAISPDNLVKATSALLEIFSELHTEKIPEDELEHVLNCYRYDLEYSRDHGDEMALRYAWGELTGCRRTISGDLRDISRVSPKGIQQTVGELLLPKNLRGAIVGPYHPKERNLVEELTLNWNPAS